MEINKTYACFVLTVSSAALLSAVIGKVVLIYWWRPRSILKCLQRQGIHGLTYRYMSGNIPEYAALIRKAQSYPTKSLSHDIMPRVLPHYANWSTIHGEQFYYWYGWTPRLNVPDPELIKQVLSNKFGHFSKSSARPDFMDLLGKGLSSVNGETWAVHRRVVSPAFRLEKLKAMTPRVLECVNTTFERWDGLSRESHTGWVEIELCGEYIALTADIIARTAFGSSYKKGKQLFDMQREQQALISESDRCAYVPGSRFLPTSKNRYRWKLHRRIQKQLHQIIHSRMESIEMIKSDHYGNDLLGMLLTANKEGTQKTLSLTVQEVVDECKTFLFAGHETTSALLTWTTMLLAQHKDWQERARTEVLTFCGKKSPDSDTLSRLKIVTMILNESLRLYPPVVQMIRYSSKDINLRHILIPKGTGLVLPILALHHSRQIWGADVNEFNPSRFAKGGAKESKHPVAFMPFSFGPRLCVGQNLALLEAKMILSILLQRFTFEISPSYRHAPTNMITLQPQYGMQIMFPTALKRALAGDESISCYSE